MMSLCDHEVRGRSVLVRVGHQFLIPWIRSHRMRTKSRAYMAITYSCVILVTSFDAISKNNLLCCGSVSVTRAVFWLHVSSGSGHVASFNATSTCGISNLPPLMLYPKKQSNCGVSDSSIAMLLYSMLHSKRKRKSSKPVGHWYACHNQPASLVRCFYAGQCQSMTKQALVGYGGCYIIRT